MISTGSEESGSISGELFTEQERVFTRDKLLQLRSPFAQRLFAKILAVQMKKVEGAEDQVLRAPANS